jgi:hypothetical protein
MGTYDNVLTHEKAGLRGGKERSGGASTKVGLVLVNLFISDPEVGERKNGQMN